MDQLAALGANQSVSQVGSSLGLGDKDTRALLDAVGPSLLRGLQRGAEREGGVDALKKALESGRHARYLEEPEAVVSMEGIADGNGILGHIFGSKDVSRNVAAGAASQTGIDASLIRKALPMLAGIAMGALNKQTDGGRKLDTGSADGGFGSIAGALLGGSDGKLDVDDVLSLAKKFF